MTHALLLDEMLSAKVAAALRTRGHDVVAVVADSSLIGLSDDHILSHATATDRAVVTENVGDFVRLDRDWKTFGRRHAGIVLVPSRAFPRDRRFIGSVVMALDALLATVGGVEPDSTLYVSPDQRNVLAT